MVRNDAGEFDVHTGDTFQFNQERGLVVIDSQVVGLVAVLPIGMAVIVGHPYAAGRRGAAEGR